MEQQQTAQRADPQPRDNHGYVIRNQTKRHPRSPDMSGQCWVNKQRYDIAGWVAVSKRSGKRLD